MKNIFLHFSIIFISITLISCKTTNQSSPSIPTSKNISTFNEPILIRFGEQMYFEDNLEVTFLKVLNDSRCPQGVQCVWQGNAEIVLKIKNPEQNISEFVNLKIDGKNHRNSSNHEEVKVNEFKFSLLELLPYPQANQSNDFMVYEALISIQKIVGN